MARLTLRAPLAGWSAPPEEIPDEVFAKRMLGDGVAVDPVGNVLRQHFLMTRAIKRA